MHKEFVPYEEALELKELGFDEPCFAYYTDEESKFIPASYSQEGTEYPTNSDLIQDWISAPLYQQAFRWFREEHDLMHIIIKVGTMEDYVYMSTIDNKRWTYKCNTYTEAEFASLRKLIEIVNQNKDE
jgi:hypothetical protein